jgi:hypothetical protein
MRTDKGYILFKRFFIHTDWSDDGTLWWTDCGETRSIHLVSLILIEKEEKYFNIAQERLNNKV